MKFLFVTKPLVMEPLGLMYLSSTIKSQGHQTALAVTGEDLERRVADFKPDFVGYSVMTGDERFYDELNRSLKSKFSFFSIAGGPHPTFFPDFFPASSFDAICRGEGERAMQQFLCSPTSTSTPNFSFRVGDRVVSNPVQPLIENLDELPFPDRSLLLDCPNIQATPIRHFIASRGCPFDCTYCFNKSFADLYAGKGKRVRFRSVENLMQEIQEVERTFPNSRLNYFQDDTFTLSEGWLRQFSEHYSRAATKPFHCHIRANTLTEGKTQCLEDAGCYSVHFAIETGNDDLRNRILNRGMSKEQILSAVELLQQSGIRYITQNMIGIPGGVLEADLETLNLNIRCRPDYAWVSIFQPYPGTALGRFCKEQGHYSGDFTDFDNNFYGSSRLNFSDEYKSQLSHLQKLFAIFVEYPELSDWRLLSPMINAPQDRATRDAYTQAYRGFRKIGDRRAYGFDL